MRSAARLAVGWLALAASSCDDHVGSAVDHLHALGFHDVACEGQGHGQSGCIADTVRFRCVTHVNGGCDSDTTACERFYIERPAP